MSFRDLIDVFVDAVDAAAAYLPVIVGAILLVAAGTLIAKICAAIARRLSERILDRLPTQPSLHGALEASGARAAAPKVIASFVFWIVFIFFVVAAVEILGLPILTELLGQVATYAPNVIAAGALVIGGVVIGRLARGLVAKGARVLGLERQADVLAGISHALIITIAVVMALEQLGIQGRVLELVLAVSLGSVLAAAGLAFALGARTAVANIIAARYVTELCQVGQEVEIEEVRGTVVQLTSTAVVVETAEGRVIVPAARFHESSPLLLEAS